MASQELDWTPAANMKLHHFEGRMPTNHIELAKLYLQVPILIYRDLRYMWEDAYYTKDAEGVDGTPENTLHKAQKETYLNELKSLSDDAVVRLDSSQDGICTSCPIGEHCKATNYRYKGQLIDVVKVEQKMLQRIRRSLIKSGCKPGVDFRIIPTEITLMDYQKQNRWTFTKHPQPITTPYEALLARMGALRRIVEKGSDIVA